MESEKTLSLQRVLGTLDLNAEWIGIREVETRTRTATVRDDRPLVNSCSFDRGLMVEVLIDGSLGYGATNDCSSRGIRRAAERAAAQARGMRGLGVHSFSRSIRPPHRGRYQFPPNPAARPLDFKAANELLFDLNRAAAVSEAIASRYCGLQYIEQEVRQVSSSGSEVSQKFCFTSYSLAVSARKNGITQQRTNNYTPGQHVPGGAEVLLREQLLHEARRLAEEAVLLASAPTCPSGVMDLVLSPGQMVLQLHESVGHPLELDRILGDERNYAGASFVKVSDFGRLVYGSPLMNVTFDPAVPGELASYACDDGALSATRQHLIQNGVLMRGLGGAESQQRSGVPGVASLRACSWNRPPIDRMGNLNLEPGNSTREEIIGSVKRGVLMDTNLSWSIDDYRRKFQFSAEYGRLIEHGRLTSLVRQPGYRGLTLPFWRSLERVGDDSTFEVLGVRGCGKGEPNQLLRVGHAAPMCLFSAVEVFGGGQ